MLLLLPFRSSPYATRGPCVAHLMLLGRALGLLAAIAPTSKVVAIATHAPFPFVADLMLLGFHL